MTSNPTDSFTNNSFIDKCLKMIPDDPYVQAQYMYFLTLSVFLGLLGYALTSWYGVIVNFQMKTLFSSVFMTAICAMSSFGLKQTRVVYLAMKSAKNIPRNEVVETQEEVEKLFKEVENRKDEASKN